MFVTVQIPGRWQVFIDQLQSSALQDCAAFYESDIDMLLSEYENSAVNETELLVGTKLWLCVRLCVCHMHAV